MSEQQAQPEDDGIDRISATLSLRSSEGSEIVLETRYIGMSPIIVIEPSEDQPDGVLSFDVTAVDLGREELAQVFELLIDVLRDGAES